MIVGVPTEVKTDEFRVWLRLVGVEMLTQPGHEVLVQSGAGIAAGFTYPACAGSVAPIVATPREIRSRC